MKKLNWRALLVLPVLAGAIALFVFHGPNWHQVHDAFTVVRWEWVVAAIALNLASVLARALAWQTAINQSLEGVGVQVQLDKQGNKKEFVTLLNSMLKPFSTRPTPTSEQIERIEGIRAAGKVLGLDILRDSKNSRERSLALTHLEDCIMWAVKGIVLENA